MHKYLIVSISLVFLFQNCKKDEIIPVNPSQTINYIYNKSETIQYRTDVTVQDDDLISYDIYFNDTITELKPVIIWVHGGGWSIGDKKNKFDAKKSYFQSLGYVLCSVNYRLSPVDANGVPNDILNSNRLQFPSHPEDVASAVNHIYNNIINYGGDKNKIVIMGHSAGAHLSSLISADPQYLNNYGLNPKTVFKGVVNFDTEAYDIKQHLLNFGVTESNGQITVEKNNFLDTDNSTVFHKTIITYLNAFGETENSWNNASPLTYINEANKPSNYFFYYRDITNSNQNRVDLISSYITSLNTGNNYIVSSTTPYSHEDINQRIGLSNQMTTDLTSFLTKCFQ